MQLLGSYQGPYQLIWQCPQPVLIDCVDVCVPREQAGGLHPVFRLKGPLAAPDQICQSWADILVVPAVHSRTFDLEF